MEEYYNAFENTWAEIFTYFQYKNRIDNIFHLAESAIS